MTALHLLPSNATKWEKAVSEAADRDGVLGPAIDDAHGFKFARPLRTGSNYGPWLLVEYGLGDIARFFDTAEAAIDAGIPWLRLRGTPSAVTTSLSWIEYASATVEDQYAGRFKWNRYQVAMGALPPDLEVPTLIDAEFLADLSDPARSIFFRGYYGYDVRGLEYGRNKWSQTIWGDSSGVRVTGGMTKWSHGRDHVGTIAADAGAQAALGVDVENGDELGWDDIPWDTPGVTWEGVVDAVAFKSFLIRRLPVLVAFRDGDSEIVGYRRPISVTDVTADGTPDAGNCLIQIVCRTGFGDAAGVDIASCAPVFRIGAAEGVKPGKLWFEPNEVAIESGYDEADMTIGSVDLDVTFKETVREHITITVEI